jgi:hypothetical protein
VLTLALRVAICGLGVVGIGGGTRARLGGERGAVAAARDGIGGGILDMGEKEKEKSMGRDSYLVGPLQVADELETFEH